MEDFMRTVYTLWLTFYYQFFFLNNLLRKWSGLTYEDFTITITYAHGDVKDVPWWALLVTGLFWDYLIVLFIRDMTKEAQYIDPALDSKIP